MEPERGGGSRRAGRRVRMGGKGGKERGWGSWERRVGQEGGTREEDIDSSGSTAIPTFVGWRQS